MQGLDANTDGMLDAKELEKAPGLKSGLKQADKDGDSKISQAEIDGRIGAWSASKTGRMTVVCQVTLNGAAVANAEVKLVPEPFLGSALPTAKGTTDGSGIVMPTAPETDNKPAGVAPGYYRVEITSAGKPLPAKYNTETTLGLEVASDSEALSSGPAKFELQ